MRSPSGLVLLSVLLFARFGSAQVDGTDASSQAGTSPQPPFAAQRPKNDGDEAGYLQRGADPENRLWTPFFKHLAADQMQFWSSPKELRKPEAWKTFGPFLGFTGGLIAGDSWISKQVPDSPSQLKRSKNISDFGAYSLVGLAGGSYLFGSITHNDHLREAGFLSGEAALNSTGVAYLLKGITQRPRPQEGDHNGTFFQGGMSFPSEHAAIAWSVASVFAHEYPGPLTQIAAYGLASAVTLTRVTAKQHFSSDVVVGSALGWYLGRQIYRAHHDPELGGAPWGELRESKTESPRNPANMGSPSVPLDSWVYPALTRLAALGYIKTAHLGMRPWTRMQVAQLLIEADEKVGDGDFEDNNGARKQVDALKSEFVEETDRLGGAANLGASLDSVYGRFAEISGPPLRDGFHFGQTIINDSGRPYSRGFNAVTGFTSHAVAGPLSFYVRGEYQHAPLFPALPDQARQVIQTVDGLPTAPPGTAVPSVNRMNLLDAYMGVQLKNWQLTFGKQELWWGADASGPMLFSSNAAPITMLQITRVEGFQLPSIFGRLGPIRFQYILGRLSGHNWVFSSETGITGSWAQTLSDQPFVTGQKFSIKPTPNLEFGFSATSVFAGSGVPFTFHTLFRAMFSTGNGLPGTPSDSGDRRGAFDFSYRIPKLRDWITFYGDAFTEDQVSPLFAWDKAAVTSGIYMPRIPKIPKLDFRVEGVFTDLPGGTSVVQHGFFYMNARYRSGYTNDGNLIASWIGRQGQGAEAWSNYWLTGNSKLQLHFRHQTVSNKFIPSGGNLNDLGASADFWLGSKVSISTGVQWERWNFPVIASTPQTNVTAQFQLGFHPHWMLK